VVGYRPCRSFSICRPLSCRRIEMVLKSLVTPLLSMPRWARIVLLCGLVPRVALALATKPILWPDSLTYLASASFMADENNYWLHEIYRTPIYPLFLSIFFHLFGHTPSAGLWVIHSQQALGVASGFLLFLILRRCFSERVALVGSCLFLLSPLQLYYETVILTEALFIFQLFVFILLGLTILEQVSKGMVSLRWFSLLGVIGGVLSLSRPIGQLLLIAFLAFYVARFTGRWRTARASALSLLVFFATIFPWMSVNHHHYGFWGISRDFGINIFHRVLDVDKTPLPATSTDTFIRETYENAPRHLGPPYFTVYHGLIRHLKHQRVPKREVRLQVDKRMSAFALEVLAAHPYDFIPNTFKNFFNLFVNPLRSIHFCQEDGGAPVLCTLQKGLVTRTFPITAARSSRAAQWGIFRYFTLFSTLDPLIAATLLLGVYLVFSRGISNQQLLITFVVLYFTGIAALFNCPDDRFRLPVDGLIFGIVAFAGGCLARWVRNCWRSRRVVTSPGGF